MIIRLMFVLARVRIRVVCLLVATAEVEGICIIRPPMFSRVVGMFSASEALVILVSAQSHYRAILSLKCRL